jgi:hypothetical protein
MTQHHDAEESAMITDFTGDSPIDIISSRDDLEAVRSRLGLRLDWHEPDEQGVTVEFEQLGNFDNAMTMPGHEIGVYLVHEGQRVAYVNLALLFALANGHYRGL